MNRSVKITLILGILAIVLVPLTRLGFEGEMAVWLYFSHGLFAILASFLGIWYSVALAFRDLHLSKKETFLLLLATLLSLISFGLIKTFGVMVIFWLPGAVLGAIQVRAIIKGGSWLSRSLKSELEKKTGEIERELERKRSEEGSNG